MYRDAYCIVKSVPIPSPSLESDFKHHNNKQQHSYTYMVSPVEENHEDGRDEIMRENITNSPQTSVFKTQQVNKVTDVFIKNNFY